MKINPHGYWENETAEGHGHDEGLDKALVEFFDKQKKPLNLDTLLVLDIGCGDGFYTNYLMENSNYTACLGVDGNPNTEEIAGKYTFVADLTERQNMTRADWVLSLEVGEHIPAEYEEIFLYNLDRHNKQGIVLSWAIRGQGGDGHVNCQDNHEIIEKITLLGYTYDEDSTQILRNSAAVYPKPCYWFRNTLMVFRRNT